MAEAPSVPNEPSGADETLREQARDMPPDELRRTFWLLLGNEEGYWHRNLRTGEAWYSPSFFEVLGLPAHAGRAEISAAIHPDDLERLEAAYGDAAARKDPFSCDLRYRNQQGEYRWVRAKGRIWHGSDGQPEHLIGRLSDIHAEKQALLQLQMLAERLDRVMAASSEAYCERTAEGEHIFQSHRLNAMLGYPPDQPMDREVCMSLIHPEDVPAMEAALQAAWQRPATWELEYRMRHCDGSYRWVRGRGRSDFDAEGKLRMTSLVGDIHERKLAHQKLEEHRHRLQQSVEERTARLEVALAEAERQREQAEQANEAKSAFLAHMSHEIRTPLNGVLGLNELALREAQSDQQRRYLTLALHSGRALLGIINDVLDFSRLSAGAIAVKSEPFDLGEVLAEPMRSIMPMVRDKGLVLMFDYVGGVTRVVGDRQRLQQIVTNLLGNAAKYTEHGHIELFAEVRHTAPGAITARVAITDTGPGMTQEIATRIFEPFVQGDDRLARRHGGTGLGLSIARSLARSIGGELTLDTVPLRGSTFVLELPLKVQPGEQPATIKPPCGNAWLVFTQLVSARRLARRLQRVGWPSEIIDGIPALFRKLEAEPHIQRPDMVVLGETALVPGTSLEQLRALIPGTHIVLLVQPDWNQPDLEAAARAAGMRIVVRPVTPTALVDLLSSRDVRDSRAVSDSGFVELLDLPDLGLDVLVAEDNMVNQIIIMEMIESLGLKARLAEDGEAAIQACRERIPAIVLMDLQMPGMDGLEAARQLTAAQRRGEMPTFPIIALTAHATPQDKESAMRAGMVGYLTKPVGLGALRGELARWLLR
jgi:PAS domain S-box-containing protein